MAEKQNSKKPCLHLTGETLEPRDLVNLSKGGLNIDLSKEAWSRVAEGRKVVDAILAEGKVAYGINTGFGLFSEVVIGPDKLRELQENLIRSHAAGVGEPVTRERTRMLLALRANVLAKGHSGVRTETLRQFLDAFNADCLSVVPCKGTVGASGDLAPLSHLALGLMGEGKMWDPKTGKIAEASKVLAANGLKPIVLAAKEGLALINGTQLITSLGAEAVERSANVARCADVACAMSLEVLKGTSNAFHPAIHASRPHPGQQTTASRLRALLLPRSQVFVSHKYKGKVQDAYCLRCAPQVHGVVHDTVGFVKGILTTEMNSATDNPMVFTGEADLPDEVNTSPLSASRKRSASDAELDAVLNSESTNETDPVKRKMAQEIKRLREMIEKKEDSVHKSERHTFYRGQGGFIISGGNFHGEYPAKALDMLAIGVTELANISERRLERLCNPQLSDLPAFLVKEGGLNSGFMIAHCTAAACASENKVLTHPSSVDTLSTSAAKEDHVSMGGFAARKALDVVENVETAIAIEILAGCQALEFFRPAKSTPPLEAVHALVRTRVKPWDKDRIMHTDIDAVVELVRSGAVWDVVKSFHGVGH
eukprot:TRINITY_DN76347_c0_g1_i1.p1 TRINITY_DN76347_c0_g1~~TRINITY_DN76347_c0_g1_i1.p1  ORF type:complete len:596 (+),score=89.34 TRINITY_DN76347_c0_g1_i1:56-1843(+)